VSRGERRSLLDDLDREREQLEAMGGVTEEQAEAMARFVRELNELGGAE
jgi:hypothetical protein